MFKGKTKKKVISISLTALVMMGALGVTVATNDRSTTRHARSELKLEGGICYEILYDEDDNILRRHESTVNGACLNKDDARTREILNDISQETQDSIRDFKDENDIVFEKVAESVEDFSRVAQGEDLSSQSQQGKFMVTYSLDGDEYKDLGTIVNSEYFEAEEVRDLFKTLARNVNAHVYDDSDSFIFFFKNIASLVYDSEDGKLISEINLILEEFEIELQLKEI